MLPAKQTDGARELAIQSVLDRLTKGAVARTSTPEVVDNPDGWITAIRRLPAAEARYAPFPDGIDERLRQALGAGGIAQPYAHQAEAIGHALSRRNVVITTPTASGKTLCYNAPVL